MFVFSPMLVFGPQTVPLPRPITQVRVQDSWDAARFKVPHQDGSLWAGRSQDGVDISIRGQFARTGDQLTLSESDMLDAIEAVRASLRLGDPSETYGLALFVDSDDPQMKRGFRACSTVKFEYDLSDRALYGYTLMVHASDPQMYLGPLLK